MKTWVKGRERVCGRENSRKNGTRGIKIIGSGDSMWKERFTEVYGYRP